MTELIPTPKWITDSYSPEGIKPHYTVEVTDSGFLLREIDLKSFNPYTFQLHNLESLLEHTGETVKVAGSLDDLYEYSRANDVEPIGTPNTDFVKVLRADSNYVVPMMFGMPDLEITQPCLVASDYKNFLRIAEDYVKSPENSVTAFRFIDHHPMYWHFVKEERSSRVRRSGHREVRSKREPRISVQTGRGWARVEMQIISNRFSFETSGTPFHTQTNYHDYALDTYAGSMDEGICELAAKIHKFYDLEGNLRSGKDEPN